MICDACGTNPVNHRILFIFNFLKENIEKSGEKIFKINKNKNISIYVEKILFNFLSFVGIIRFNKNVEKASTLRSFIIWEEAKKRNIEMEQIVLFGKYIDEYRAKINGKMFYFKSLPIPAWLPQEDYDWVDDKFILFNKFKMKNIPVPATKMISTFGQALDSFEILQKPLIIKPKYGSRGRHTTTNINTKEELKNAFLLAREITPYMVIQEHIFGSVYRATVINNELVGFFRGDPPFIIGDNKKTISELIEEKNRNRNEKISEILINKELISFIKRQGYNLESILKENVIINLRAKTGRNYGGYTKEMLKEVHPKMYFIFRDIGKILKAPVLGFDLIIKNPKEDPDLQTWGIIECNSLPFIDLHYDAQEGEIINLAPKVWDLWLIPSPQ